MKPRRERETTDDETPTPPPSDQAVNGGGMKARDAEPPADPKEPLSTTTTNSPNRLASEPPLPHEGRRSGSPPIDRRRASPTAGSRRSPDFRRHGSSPPRELNRHRSRSPFVPEFGHRRRRSPPPGMEFGRRGGHNSPPLTENPWHSSHGFRNIRRSPPHRGSPPLDGFRGRGSPPRMADFRRQGSPPVVELRRRGGSPPMADFRRHRSPVMVDARPYGRVVGDPGYPMHTGPVSPPHRRRPDDARFHMEFDGLARPSRHGHGFRGGRQDGRLRDRDSLLMNGREKGVGRGQGQSTRGPAPNYELRNDPNLSPREGDWICQNPSCGNLNFARRTHCNICNKHRHSNQLQNRSLSPRRGYFPSPPAHHRSPPPHHRSPPVRVLGPPPERALHREPVRYHHSPPRDWAMDAGPFNPRGERLVRADLLECRERSGGFGWQGNEEFPRRDRGGVREGFLPVARRGRRSISPMHDKFARDPRDRSRSPIGDRKLKFVGTGRGDRDFGAGYKRSRGDSFRRSRGDGRVVSRGRSGAAY